MIPTAICLDAVEEQGLVAEALVPGACHPMRFAQVSKASPVPKVRPLGQNDSSGTRQVPATVRRRAKSQSGYQRAGN